MRLAAQAKPLRAPTSSTKASFARTRDPRFLVRSSDPFHLAFSSHHVARKPMRPTSRDQPSCLSPKQHSFSSAEAPRQQTSAPPKTNKPAVCQCHLRGVSVAEPKSSADAKMTAAQGVCAPLLPNSGRVSVRPWPCSCCFCPLPCCAPPSVYCRRPTIPPL